MDYKSVQSLRSELSLNDSLSESEGLRKNDNNLVMKKWSNIVNNWQQSSCMKIQIKELIKLSGGIPHDFRPLVWQLLCGSNDEHSLMTKMKTIYHDYLKQQSSCENAIRRDITRTYPQHDLFKNPSGDGQIRLFNIMKAYSIHDREVGYCQGSGFIGGLLLIQMPEEDAFGVLVSLLMEHQLRNLYTPNMSELGLNMYQLDCLVDEHLPKLSLHFRSHNFHATVYASGWFLTLFALPFSIEISSRVMDLFIIEGFEIIFKISLAYLTIFQDELMKIDMESMLRFLQSIGPKKLEENTNRLFDITFQIKLSSRMMKKIEKEYLAQKIEEEDNQIEPRRLRTENGLLLRRIECLEKEVEQLTQHLLSRNILITQSAEEISRLKSDLMEANRKVENLRHNLGGTETQLQLAVGQLNGRICEENAKDIMRERRSSDLSSDMVHQLQSQLVNVRLKEAETNSSLRELKEKCRELEEENHRLSKTPTEEVAQLQEDLVVIKLREGEAGLTLKENQKRLNEVNRLWMAHLEQCPTTNTNKYSQVENRKERFSLHENSDSTIKTAGVMQLTRKIVEAEYAFELNYARQKMMEMEAQQHINNRQISRRDEDIISLKEKMDDNMRIQKDLRNELNEADRKFVDLETKRKEDLMMWKIQKMEVEHIVAELKQKVAQLEIQREEISTSSKMGCKETVISTLANSKQSITRAGSIPLSTKWKDLPHTIMTDSIGPLDEICFNPDDPMITSIYIHPNDCRLKTNNKKNLDLEYSSGRTSVNSQSIDKSLQTNNNSQEDSDADVSG